MHAQRERRMTVRRDRKALIEAKTVTIAKLMAIAPPGTQDPTPFIYDSTMYSMAGLMGVAALAHLAVRPVAAKYFEPREKEA